VVIETGERIVDDSMIRLGHIPNAGLNFGFLRMLLFASHAADLAFHFVGCRFERRFVEPAGEVGAVFEQVGLFRQKQVDLLGALLCKSPMSGATQGSGEDEALVTLDQQAEGAVVRTIREFCQES